VSEEHHRHAADTRWKKSLNGVGRVVHVVFTAFGGALKAMSGGGNAPLTPPDPGAPQRREDYRP